MSSETKSPVWAEIIIQVDELIRLGKINSARRILNQIIPKDIPRKEMASFARLARRTRMNYFALRILKPVIKVDNLFSSSASEEELSLYAGSLIRIGGRKQGLDILKKLDWKKNPEILMFQVDAYFSEWNYKDAIPLLKKYIRSLNISDYQRLVGRLNLAAAYVFEGLVGLAEDLLSVVRAECKFKGYQLLYANSLELSAQVLLSKKKFAEALTYLELASKILKEEINSYGFFLKKWSAITELLKNPTDKNHQKQISLLKDEARRELDWESLRQIEFYQALATRDEHLYFKLMLGTPYANYRNVLKRKFNRPPELPAEFRFRLGGDSEQTVDSNSETIPVLYVNAGKGSNISIRGGSLLHRFLMILTRDFYRPIQVGEAFSLLYPNEYFDPESSPGRVRNLIKRLVNWFIENNVQLTIHVEKQTIILKSKGLVDLVTSRQKEELNINKFRILTLNKKTRSDWFTTTQAASLLGISQRSVQRLLSECNKTDLQSVGRGQGRRYRFTVPLRRLYYK